MLLSTVADLLGDDLVNSSTGLLRGGAIGWRAGTLGADSVRQ